MTSWQQGMATVLVVLFLGAASQPASADKGHAPQALPAPAGSAGEAANADGVTHYAQGHWDVAEKHFREAVAADEKLAEAHYNLALALDNQDRHKEATEEFDRALKLAPDNPAIAESGILKAHLKRMHGEKKAH